MKIPNSRFKIKPAFNITWVLEFNDLPRTTGSDKVLHDKALIFLKIENMMRIKEVFLQWFTNFFDKKSSGDVATLSRSETLATRDDSSI